MEALKGIGVALMSAFGGDIYGLELPNPSSQGAAPSFAPWGCASEGELSCPPRGDAGGNPVGIRP